MGLVVRSYDKDVSGEDCGLRLRLKAHKKFDILEKGFFHCNNTCLAITFSGH